MQGYQLQPGQTFPIVSALQDPADSTTYYPQAIIRNAVTMATLATVSMVRQSNGLYLYSYQVPEDPSGQGLWIEITKTFYADAAHTDNGTPYGVESATHLVRDVLLGGLAGGGGGGGSADIDYKRLEKIFKHAVDQIPEPPEAPEPEPVDLKPILQRLDTLGKEIKSAMPVVPPVNFSGILAQLNALEQAVKSIPTPEKSQPVDLDPMITALDNLRAVVVESNQHMAAAGNQEAVPAMLQSIKDFFLKDVDDIKAKFDVIQKLLQQPITATFQANFKSPETPERPSVVVPPTPQEEEPADDMGTQEQPQEEITQ